MRILGRQKEVAKNSDRKGFSIDIAEDLISEAVKSVEKHRSNDEISVEVEAEAEEAAPAVAKTAVSPDTSQQSDDKSSDDYQRFVRVSADYENFRKRYKREKEDWQRFGAERFLKEFLPVLDNLDRAMAQEVPGDDAAKALAEGLKLVMQQLKTTLVAQGIKTIEPLGDNFDPLLHEGMAMKVTNDAEPGTILEVHQKGYKLWDRLLRPALVTVAASEVEETD